METTTVVNILDNRTITYHLPPEKAVVAAFEEFEHGNNCILHLDPEKHPQFRSYRRGFSCGDWIALKPSSQLSRLGE